MTSLSHFNGEDLENCAEALEHAHTTFNKSSVFNIEATNAYAARFIETYLADEGNAGLEAARMRTAIAAVCEGFTLPDDARKILEQALFN